MRVCARVSECKCSAMITRLKPLMLCAVLASRPVRAAADMDVEGDGCDDSATPSTEEPTMRVQCIPKANSSFALAWGGNLVVVDGQKLQQRGV